MHLFISGKYHGFFLFVKVASISQCLFSVFHLSTLDFFFSLLLCEFEINLSITIETISYIASPMKCQNLEWPQLALQWETFFRFFWFASLKVNNMISTHSHLSFCCKIYNCSCSFCKWSFSFDANYRILRALSCGYYLVG